MNPWTSEKFGDFSFPKASKISGIEANYMSLFKELNRSLDFRQIACLCQVDSSTFCRRRSGLRQGKTGSETLTGTLYSPCIFRNFPIAFSNDSSCLIICNPPKSSRMGMSVTEDTMSVTTISDTMAWLMGNSLRHLPHLKRFSLRA